MKVGVFFLHLGCTREVPAIKIYAEIVGGQQPTARGFLQTPSAAEIVEPADASNGPVTTQPNQSAAPQPPTKTDIAPGSPSTQPLAVAPRSPHMFEEPPSDSASAAVRPWSDSRGAPESPSTQLSTVAPPALQSQGTPIP